MNINQMIPITVLLFALSTPAAADLIFNIDFGRDGSYEDSLSLDFNETTWADIYISGVESPGLISMGFKITYDDSVLEIINKDASGWDFSKFSTAASSLMVSGGMFSDTRIGNDILLASVQFKGITATGIATTALTLFDGSGDNFVLDNKVILDSRISTSSGINLAGVSVTGAPITGTGIPQPGSLLLLAAGLFGFLFAKNRIETNAKEQ
ncbi:hypothetical protein [Chromatium okenii]|uniref:Ice-binding protein C-terminal domain-containing protein n=1 Tax=Chromatium okenii TaxID=61644 RepID=A0A2S7XT32_9GAMM|nr:hypothetical protein [Chromatium okenii]MBV5308012.1 hypothetical protein [Chromatium okenii]PQJ96796.1 hypothetical protein CXB77_05750 [Chromatium okenii]